MSKFEIIKGNEHSDQRGRVSFVNDFDMSNVKRMYFIENTSTDTVRAWQAHKIESKYFIAVKGSFTIGLVEIKNWDNLNTKSNVNKFSLSEYCPAVLQVPGGYANAIKADTDGAKLMVLSNLTLEEASSDNFKFDQDIWEFTSS